MAEFTEFSGRWDESSSTFTHEVATPLDGGITDISIAAVRGEILVQGVQPDDPTMLRARYDIIDRSMGEAVDERALRGPEVRFVRDGNRLAVSVGDRLIDIDHDMGVEKGVLFESTTTVLAKDTPIVVETPEGKTYIPGVKKKIILEVPQTGEGGERVTYALQTRGPVRLAGVAGDIHVRNIGDFSSQGFQGTTDVSVERGGVRMENTTFEGNENIVVADKDVAVGIENEVVAVTIGANEGITVPEDFGETSRMKRRPWSRKVSSLTGILGAGESPAAVYLGSRQGKVSLRRDT